MELISIVIPCYNEEDNVAIIYERINKIFSKLPYRVEIIFIDDGSTDETADKIKRLSEIDSKVLGLFLSRNFGHQMASTAGIDQSLGDAVILIDADLQDPPEVLPQMIELWKKGHDVVYGVRKKRKGEKFFKLLTAKIYYRLIQAITHVHIPVDTGDFRLLSRKVVNCLQQMPERSRFLRGMISWIGFNQTSVLYTREARFMGHSKYPYSKMIKFAWDGITTFSSFPLKLATWTGVLISFLSFLFIIWNIYQRLIDNKSLIVGWSSLIVTILFMGGIQILFLGIIGEYIARIFNEVKKRPLYLIKETTKKEKNVKKSA